MPWVYDVHSGGKKIPQSNHEKIRKQVQVYAAKRPWKNKYKLQVRFKGQFCYVDALETDGTVSPLEDCDISMMENGVLHSIHTAMIAISHVL